MTQHGRFTGGKSVYSTFYLQASLSAGRQGVVECFQLALSITVEGFRKMVHKRPLNDDIVPSSIFPSIQSQIWAFAALHNGVLEPTKYKPHWCYLQLIL